jgi:hypothetical protein
MPGCADIGGCGRRREPAEGVGLVQLRGSTTWVCHMCYVMPVWIERERQHVNKLADEKRAREEADGAPPKKRKRAA